MTATAELWQFIFSGDVEESHASQIPRDRDRRRDANTSTRDSSASLLASGVAADAADDMLLVPRIQSGDESAFRALYLTHVNVLIGVARHIVHDLASAEDLVHDVFVGIWARREHFAPEHVAAYLVGAVRKRALDQVRHTRVIARTEKRHDDVLAVMIREMPSPDQPVMRTELAKALSRAVQQLPERRRTALLLRVLHGVSYREIAQILEVGETAAHMLVTRTLASLRPLFVRFLDQG